MRYQNCRLAREWHGPPPDYAEPYERICDVMVPEEEAESMRAELLARHGLFLFAKSGPSEVADDVHSMLELVKRLDGAT